jgi:hypothetical protein
MLLLKIVTKSKTNLCENGYELIDDDKYSKDDAWRTEDIKEKGYAFVSIPKSWDALYLEVY